jgi:hypothetical protein
MVIVQNLKTIAVSRYEGGGAGGPNLWDFNAFAEAGGEVFASGPDGIFLLDSDSGGRIPDDDGADIRMTVVCGPSDFGNARIKRITDAYVRLKGGVSPASIWGAVPGLMLSVTTDDNESVDYVVEDTDEVLHTRKINLAKGKKGVFWMFALSSDAGMIEIESVRLNVEILSRKVI